MSARELAEKALVALLSAALFMPSLVKIGFGESFLLELIPAFLASYVIGYSTGRVASALVLLLASYTLAVFAAIQLIRAPLDAFLGTLSGDLAALVVEKNIAFTSLVVVIPLSFIFLVIGAYQGEVLRRRSRPRSS